MGKHFDGLVDLVRKGLPTEAESFGNPKEYITRLLNRCSLFEFPFEHNIIHQALVKYEKTIDSYIIDYFTLSGQQNQTLIMPFRVTGIENPEFLIIGEHKKDNHYSVLFSATGVLSNKPVTNLILSDVILNRPSGNKVSLEIEPLLMYQLNNKNLLAEFDLIDVNKKTILPNGVDNKSGRYENGGRKHAISLINRGIESWVEQLVYIMDPHNFILERESNQSVKYSGKTVLMPKKTMLRPHYIFLGKKELTDFIKDESKEPYPAHPVEGHFRTLTAERYKEYGKVVYVNQYFTGNGTFIGRNGWNYQVYIKVSKPSLKVMRYKYEKKEGDLSVSKGGVTITLSGSDSKDIGSNIESNDSKYEEYEYLE